MVQGPNLVEGGLARFPDVLAADPKLGPIRDNGGPTQTMALLLGSPAINAGDNTLIPDGITTDRQGSGFGRFSGAGPSDLGHVEVQNQPPTISTFATAVTVNEGSLATNFGALRRPRRPRFRHAHDVAGRRGEVR